MALLQLNFVNGWTTLKAKGNDFALKVTVEDIQHTKYLKNRQLPLKALPQGFLILARQGRTQEDYLNCYLLNLQAAKMALTQQHGQHWESSHSKENWVTQNTAKSVFSAVILLICSTLTFVLHVRNEAAAQCQEILHSNALFCQLLPEDWSEICRSLLSQQLQLWYLRMTLKDTACKTYQAIRMHNWSENNWILLHPFTAILMHVS